MKFIESSVKRPVATSMLFFALLILSIYAMTKLKTDYMPEFTMPAISVVCTYTNVGPNEIEESITRKLVEIAGTVQNVKKIKSTSAEGISIVSVEFVWGTDISVASNDMREKIEQYQSRLPEGADKPYILKYDTTSMPVIRLIAESDNLALGKKFCDEVLKNELEQVEGVAQAQVEGGIERAILVSINRRKLEAFNLTLNDVVSRIKAENINLPAGEVYLDRNVYTIRGIGEYQRVEDIKKIVIAIRNRNQIPMGIQEIQQQTNTTKVPILLEYIAEIKEGYKDIRLLHTVNNRQGITITIRKQSGANTVEVVEKIKEKLERIKNIIPPNIKIYELMNTGNRVRYAINDVSDSAILGGLIALFVIFVFLRNPASTAVIAISLPSSIIVTFLLMYFSKMTLNMLSFGGLALGVGMLVDNSIVVIENIFRHREKGESPMHASIIGTKQVFMPIFASTMTTICVFLPVMFMQGVAGVLFKEMALTVTFSLLASLFVSVTMIPMLTSKFLLNAKKKQRLKIFQWLDDKMDRFFTAMDNGYSVILAKAIKRRKLVLFSAFGLFLISLQLCRAIPTGFMPENERDEFNVELELREGTRIEISSNIAQKLSAVIKDRVRGVQFVSTRIGTGEDRGSIVKGKIGSHLINFRIVMPPRGAENRRRMREVRREIRRLLAKVPGGNMNFEFSSMTGSSASPIEIQILGHDFHKAIILAKKIRDLVKKVPGITDAQINQSEGVKEFIIKIDRIKAATYGFSVSDVFNIVKTGYAGTDASIFHDNGEEVDINVRFQDRDRIDIPSLQTMVLKSPLGYRVPLSNVAQVEMGIRPLTINRLGNQRVVYVTANTPTGVGEKIQLINQRIREKLYPLPDGFTINYGSEYQDRQDSFQELAAAFVISIILIYMIMASQFESIKHPLIILITIPLAVIGVIFLFFLINQEFNVIGFLGIIILAGIVVNNAIVLVDYINVLRRENGYSLESAITEAGRTRLRPILMTTLTTVLGLVPMGIGVAEGSEARAPMALAIIGGLTISTLLTLVVIPVIYYIVERRSIKMGTLKRKYFKAIEEQEN